jgi:hypothetical protein
MCCKEFKKEWGIKSHDCFSAETTAKENNKTLRIERKRGKGSAKVCKIHVDDCLISDPETKKCDYAFRICETGEMLFVELKGVDVFTSVDQIRRTIGLFREKVAVPNGKITGFVVSGSMPKKSNTKFRDLQRAFLKEFKGDLKRSTDLGIYQM